ncbi:MAG TPA: hypothetical protein VFQ91_12405 [Bryobacteraceae bacterium]|nr:hypothetical protein [Bryobacteraceae bacterium]
MIFRFLLAAAALASLLPAQSEPPRVSPRDFAIMAWGGIPSKPELIRDMRNAGLNIAGFCNAADLDTIQSAGLHCFVSHPKMFVHEDGAIPDDGTLDEIFTDFKKTANHPASLGIYLRDEPNMRMIPSLAKLAARVRKDLPGKWPYVNLFPTYVSRKVLGTDDYEHYVRQLLQPIDQPFLSWDNYALFANGEVRDYYYQNLAVFRKVSVESGRPFWNCILGQTLFNYMEPSDATFHFQVYSSLAYGARGIQYFTYFAPSYGNFRQSAIDPFGNKTATWDMMRRMNNELHALAPTLVKLKSTGVYHFPDVPRGEKGLEESQLVEKIGLRQSELKLKSQGTALVGEFVDDKQRPYLMLVNKDMTASYGVDITLKASGKKLIQVSPYTGKEMAFGGEMQWIAPGAGMLFRVE